MRRRDRGWAIAMLAAFGSAISIAACGPTGGVGNEPPATAGRSSDAGASTVDPGLPDPDTQSSGSVTVTLQGASEPLAVAALACSWADGMVDAFIALGPVHIAGEAVYIDLAPSAPDPADAFSIYRDEDAAYHGSSSSGTVEVVERSEGDASGTIRFTDLGPDAATLPPDVDPPGPGASLRPLGDDPAYGRLTGTASWSCDPGP